MPATYDDDRDDPQPGDVTDGSWDDDAVESPDMMCPECRGAVIEDANRCPHCGAWITPVEPNSAFSKKWWLALAVVLMLIAMARLVF